MYDAFDAIKSGIWLKSAQEKEYKTLVLLVSHGKMRTKHYQSSPLMLMEHHVWPSCVRHSPRKMLK